MRENNSVRWISPNPFGEDDEHGNTGARSPIIEVSQAMLADYLAGLEPARQFKKLQEQIKAALDDGVCVEAGPRSAKLRVVEQAGLLGPLPHRGPATG